MRRWALILVLVGGAACGGDEGGKDASGDSRKVNTLAASEIKALCDWYADQWGGYGKEVDCGDGLSVSGPESASECKPTECTATVAELKACASALVRDKCNFDVPTECTKLPASCGGL